MRNSCGARTHACRVDTLFDARPRIGTIADAARTSACATFLLAACLAAPLPKNEADEGWIQLHDGESGIGWSASGSGWSLSGGALMTDGTGNGAIRSNSAFTEFLLRFEVRATYNARASLIVQAAREGSPRETGYEIPLSGAPQWMPYE